MKVHSFSTKAYVVVTQKNHLNEMVLLSTHNFMLPLMGKENFPIFMVKIFAYFGFCLI